MSDLQRDLEEEDEVRRLVTRPEHDLVVPPFAAVGTRARRSHVMPILAFAAAAAVLVVAVVAAPDVRRVGSPGDVSTTAQPQTGVPVKARPGTVLLVISGEVLVRPTPHAPLRAGTDGQVLDAGASVQAEAPNGRAILTFPDGSTIELEPGTTISISEVSLGLRGEIVVRLGQDRGRSWTFVQPLLSPYSRFHVTTPSATVVAHGTSFELDVAGASGEAVTTVNVFHGQVDVVAAGAVRTVTAAQTTRVVQGSAPGAAQPIGPPPVCLRMELTSTAMMTVTDPHGRSVGRTPRGTVSQIPQATVNSPAEATQLVDIRSPKAGEWEVGIVANGDGGEFQLVVETVFGTRASGRTVALTSSIKRGQQLVASMRVTDDGQVTFGAPRESSQTRAKIANVGSTPTAPLPQAKRVVPVDRPPDGCAVNSR